MHFKDAVAELNADKALLAFAFLLTFLSGFGQTFFIGLFAADLRAAADLSQATFGVSYSLATLMSAATLYYVGALMDRISLGMFAAGSVALLGVGCLTVATGEHFLSIFVGLSLLRFAGQGLLSHAAVVATARAFKNSRGKALTIALLGHPAGEAILPPLAVVLTGLAGWRLSWIAAACLLLVAVPFLFILAKGQDAEAALASSRDNAARPTIHDASRLDVLRDMHFYLLLPASIVPAFVVTGIFVHQSQLLEEKNWTTAWFATSFIGFAAGHVLGMISSGSFVDRLSARRLMPVYPLPLVAVCIFVVSSDSRFALVAFLTGAGVVVGAASTIGSALWAELYGATHLGAIRAMAVSAAIVSTALAPALFGLLLDLGVSMNAILTGCAGLTAGTMLSAQLSARLWPKRDALNDEARSRER